MVNEYELIIIGGGAAGFAAAMKADEFKAKALMINNNAVGVGGTCLNVGCLPTKHLLYIGELLHKADAHDFKGLEFSPSFDFRTIVKEKDKLIQRLRNEKYEKVLGSLSNVAFLEGNAKFVSKTKIEVDGKVYSADKFIIATGSSTFIPPVEGISQVDYLTNIEALQLQELPKSMIILGGGVLGIEFAQMFSRFGTKVCLLQQAERILKREEPELANLLQKYLQDEGIEICTKVSVKSAKQDGDQKIVTLIIDEKERTYRADELLVATGRRSNTLNLGLEKLGVRLGKKREIIVNKKMQAAGNIWAAGDVTGEPMLETVAARGGMMAASNALASSEDKKEKMDYRVMPHAVFTDPQLAGVGLTDEEATEKATKCRCSTVPMELVPKAQAIKDIRGAIKIVLNSNTQKIIGVHILAPEAADLIHEGIMIIKNKMSVDEVIDTLHVFPTLSESIKIAAQSFRRDITKMSCCVE